MPYVNPAACRLAIMGLTDQVIHQRINPTDYQKWTKTLEGYVTGLNGELVDSVGGHSP